jgi:GNAT superfamily N-acetyltransferase
MKITIRNVALKDSESITELSNQLGYQSENRIIQERLTDIMNRDENYILVALTNEKIVGWIHGFYCRRIESEPFIEIGGLVVDEHYRKNGIATMLIEKIIDCSFPAPCNNVRVRCNVVRKDSHVFYEKIGFKLMKEQKVYNKELS